jgi:hypothetical protein
MNKIQLNQQVTALYPAQGRLTTESGVPVSTSDQAAKTNLYYTPYTGNYIGFLDGSILTFSEPSLLVIVYTASKPYDIWIYNDSGTAKLESTVWTNTTTRATALARTNGVLHKNGDTTRRYLGTIYINGTGGQIDNTITSRCIWNYYNRVTASLYVRENTGHSYNGAARKWNNSDTNNLLGFVTGVQEDTLSISLNAVLNAGADASSCIVEPYLDGAFLNVTYLANYNIQKIIAGSTTVSAVSAGYHTIQTYELGNHNSSTFGEMTLNAIYKG